MEKRRFDHDGKNWIWTRADGKKIVLSSDEIHDLSEMAHRAARMSNPKKGSYIKADGEYDF